MGDLQLLVFQGGRPGLFEVFDGDSMGRFFNSETQTVPLFAKLCNGRLARLNLLLQLFDYVHEPRGMSGRRFGRRKLVERVI